MFRYSESVASSINGEPIQNAQIYVYTVNPDGTNGSPAQLYVDDGVTTLNQPALTDNLGTFFFYIANGTYNFKIVTPDGGVRILPGVQIADTASIARAVLAQTGDITPTLPLTPATPKYLVREPDGSISHADSQTANIANALGTATDVAPSQAAVNTLIQNSLGIDTAKASSQAALASPAGASGVGFQQAGTGVIARTSRDKMRETYSLQDFGAKNDDSTDNSSAFAAAVSAAQAAATTSTPFRLYVPAGIYRYTTSPNWGVQGLHIDCAPGVIFKHMGAGNAFVIDGGATGGGIFSFRLTGKPTIQGNAASMNGVYVRALQHSFVSANVRDVSNAALLTQWAVCSEFDIRCSPVGYPAFTVTPAFGIYADQRGSGEQTASCRFLNPVIEGLNNYGIALVSASQNGVHGGTSEANVGGITIYPASFGNRIEGLDCESDSSTDIFDRGSRNVFINCLSSGTAMFNGVQSLAIGGTYNIIDAGGSLNAFVNLSYAANGGAFTIADPASGVTKQSVRNATSSAMDPDLRPNPVQTSEWYGAGNSGLLVGNAPAITGGAAGDTVFYKRTGGGVRLFVQGAGEMFGWGPEGISFFGGSRVAKPTVSGSKGGNAALGSLVSALAALGLINDTTS